MGAAVHTGALVLLAAVACSALGVGPGRGPNTPCTAPQHAVHLEAAAAALGWSWVLASNASIEAASSGWVQAWGWDGRYLAGGNASDVIAGAIDALPHGGGTLFFRRGVYHLTAPVHIDRSSVEIRGENSGADVFFTSDGFYNGVSNKTATVFVAHTDGFVAGNSSTCRNMSLPRGGGHCLVFGITFRDLLVTGLASDAAGADGDYSTGAGIWLAKVDTSLVENVQVVRKEHGVHLGQPLTEGDFQYDRVSDVFQARSLYLAYCRHGLFQSHWSGNVRIRDVFGYMNQAGLMHVNPLGNLGVYDWLVDGLMSQADAWNATNRWDSPVFFYSAQDVELRHLTIASNGDKRAGAQSPLITLVTRRAGDAASEWYRSHFRLSHVILTGALADAIKLEGSGGLVEVDHVVAGSTGSQSFYGGSPVVHAVVNNSRCPGNPPFWTCDSAGDISVSVTAGFANSSLAHPQTQWFVGVRTVRGVAGFNPVGRVELPFSVAGGTVGLNGDRGEPELGRAYSVTGVDVMLTVGQPHNVSVFDARGSPILSSATNVAPLTLLPVGYSVVIHSFSDIVVAGI